MVTDLARRYARALASGDAEAIARCYHPDARSFGPLAWPEEGAGAIAAAMARSAARLDRLEVEPHDAFADPTGERAALRLVRRWSQGVARRSAIETRYLRLADGLITEEFAGPNTFQLADLELNQWGMVPADTGTDPNPEVLAASPTQVSGKRAETAAPTPSSFLAVGRRPHHRAGRHRHSYGIPRYELTVWRRQYPTDTEDPAPQVDAGNAG